MDSNVYNGHERCRDATTTAWNSYILLLNNLPRWKGIQMVDVSLSPVFISTRNGSELYGKVVQ